MSITTKRLVPDPWKHEVYSRRGLRGFVGWSGWNKCFEEEDVNHEAEKNSQEAGGKHPS